MTERQTDTLLDGPTVEQAVLPALPTTTRSAVVTVVPTPPVGPHETYVAGLLDTLVERRHIVDRAEADTLALVCELADTRPGEAETGSLRVADQEPPLPVAETVLVDLAARLGTSHRSALRLVLEAVEVRDRLPRLWGLVQAGRLQVWKARLVARATACLPDPVVAFVDAQVAVTAVRNQLPDLRRLVLVAVNRCDPDLAEGREEAARDHRDVVFDFSASTDHAATATLHATVDLLDALDLDATVTDLAATLDRLGDHTPVGIRRARALGALANPQRTLDLFGDPVAARALDDPRLGDVDGHSPDATATGGSSAAGMGSERLAGRRMPWSGQREWNSQVGQLYLHLDATDLRALLETGLPGDGDQPAVGGGVDLERLGAASLRLVQHWLGRVARVSVRPVLDLGTSRPVDRHDPPEQMREQVVLRDGQCVFPGCRVHARACDQDHITPYLPLDKGGPPGQTTPENLACLCRRHHRMKTHHGWHYHRARDGTYTWTDPRGIRYTTTPRPLHPHLAA